MTMQYYLIKPKDPLIIRSGRPFEEISDAEAARFPSPSTLAGALRNIHARSTGKTLDENLLDIGVVGPLPVKLNSEGQPQGQQSIMVPKPADVQYFYNHERKETQLVGSAPTALKAGEGCDLPPGLLPLQPEQQLPGKPVSGPNWWSLSDLLKWRQGDDRPDFRQIRQNGWEPAAPDIRTHIAMENNRRAPISGQIFQTTGLTMWQQCPADLPFPDTPIGILGGIQGAINKCWLNLGGEKRLAEVEACALWPLLPETLAQNIATAGGLSMTFLTPGLFNQGWLPGWLNQDTLTGTPPGCRDLALKLRAAALAHWQPQSGWNLAKRQPRATRKMVPAGATYWFELIQAQPPLDELNSLWLMHLCDQPQDNRNGFGMALPAAYDKTLF